MAQNVLTLSAGGVITELATNYADLSGATFTGPISATTGTFTVAATAYRALYLAESFSVTPYWISGSQRGAYIGVNSYVEAGLFNAVDTGPGSFVIQMLGHSTDTSSSIQYRYRAAGTAANTSPTVVAKMTNTGSMVLGGSSINANAILDLTSTTKAFMPPRMTTTQKNAIASPTAGMVVYDSTLNKLCVYTTAWETVTSV